MDQFVVYVGHAAGRSRVARWSALGGFGKALSLICCRGVPFVWSVILLMAPMGMSVAGEKFEWCGKNVLCRTLEASDEKTSAQKKAASQSAVTSGGSQKNN